MQINETSGSTVEVRKPDGKWQVLKGTHLDVHDAHAAGVNAILAGVDEARITTVVELQVVGRRRRAKA